MELHPDLIAAIGNFYEEEEARSWDGRTQTAEETQEAAEEGKSKASN